MHWKLCTPLSMEDGHCRMSGALQTLMQCSKTSCPPLTCERQLILPHDVSQPLYVLLLPGHIAKLHVGLQHALPISLPAQGRELALLHRNHIRSRMLIAIAVPVPMTVTVAVATELIVAVLVRRALSAEDAVQYGTFIVISKGHIASPGEQVARQLEHVVLGAGLLSGAAIVRLHQ